jgi:hypothetical protein
MKSKKFRPLCEDVFRFLIDEFGCHVESRDQREYADCITYKNKTTAIIIMYEIYEERVRTLLCRLVDGKIPPYPLFVRPDTVLNQFDLLDLVKIKDQKLFNKLLSQEGKEVLSETIMEHATALRKYGRDIIRGNFSDFKKLEAVVKKRANNQGEE